MMPSPELTALNACERMKQVNCLFWAESCHLAASGEKPIMTATHAGFPQFH